MIITTANKPRLLAYEMIILWSKEKYQASTQNIETCSLIAVHEKKNSTFCSKRMQWTHHNMGIDVIDRSPRTIRIRLLLLFFLFESTCSSHIYRRHAKKDHIKRPFNSSFRTSVISLHLSPIFNHTSQWREEKIILHTNFLRHVIFLLFYSLPKEYEENSIRKQTKMYLKTKRTIHSIGIQMNSAFIFIGHHTLIMADKKKNGERGNRIEDMKRLCIKLLLLLVVVVFFRSHKMNCWLLHSLFIYK